MIMTFDFALMAQKDDKLMQAINNALHSQKDEEVYTDIHKLSFRASKQTVIIKALSENSPFHYKIIPKEIKYTAIEKLINGNWNDISEDEIMDVE